MGYIKVRLMYGTVLYVPVFPLGCVVLLTFAYQPDCCCSLGWEM